MTDVTLSIADLKAGLREAMEIAWEAGWQAAHADHNDNPYREQA